MQRYQDPPCNLALIIMHMLKMALSHDDNDYLFIVILLTLLDPDGKPEYHQNVFICPWSHN